MEDRVFKYGQFIICFHSEGEGQDAWFTFHGAGQTKKDYFSLEKTFHNKSRVFHVDLPYHGESFYSGKVPSIKEWNETFGALLETYQIEKISLSGFSLGCRMVYPLINAFPDRIQKVVLIAPDGLTKNFWYQIATHSVGKHLFKYFIFKPGFILTTAILLKKLSIISNSFFRFVQSQVKSRKQRWRIYRTWIFFRQLSLPPEILVRKFNQFQIPLTIVLGAEDEIVNKKKLQKFISAIHHCDVVEINTTHHQLLNKTGDFTDPLSTIKNTL